MTFHLTSGRIRAILEGTLPPDESQALLEHLDSECPVCATALENGPDLDTLVRLMEAECGWEHEETENAGALDSRDRGAIWTVVSSALPRAEKPVQRPPTVEPEHVATTWRIQPPNRAVRRATAGLVVALAAMSLIFLRKPVDYLTRVKGENAPPRVELAIVAGTLGENGFTANRRLASGDLADRDATLVFEVDADQAAARYVFVVDGKNAVTVLYPAGMAASIEEAGPRQVMANHEYVALSLGDMQGPITVVAAASRGILDPATDIAEPWQKHHPSSSEVDLKSPASYSSITLELAP